MLAGSFSSDSMIPVKDQGWGRSRNWEAQLTTVLLRYYLFLVAVTRRMRTVSRMDGSQLGSANRELTA
jgi:hypothetical protein